MNNSISYNKLNRQHIVIAIIALILSVGLHIALFITLPGLKLSMPIIASERNADVLTSHIKLDDVEIPDSGTKQADAGKNGIAGHESISKLLNLDNAAQELALSPDETVTAPPVIVQDDLDKTPMVKPDVAEVREHWEPRQDIIAIETKLAASEVNTLPRYNIPMIERVVEAPDILDPVDRDAPAKSAVKQASKIMSAVAVKSKQPAVIKSDTVIAGKDIKTLSEREEKLDVGTAPKEKNEEVIAEKPTEVTEFKPIENFLKATITTYSNIRDYRYGYFRIEINRAGQELLPVMSKDVLFVQDCSASMSEQRLYFCRQALTQSLAYLEPGDRFNVISFKNTNSLCFKNSAEVNAGTKQKARDFIERMHTGGNTDIYDSMRQVVERENDNERPVIAVLISDGVPTSGITDSTRIIGNITKMNNGEVSIFSYGTTTKANAYLLGLISYCNRGDSRLVSSGRWGIPEDITSLVRSISRPVLTDIRFYLADNKNIEMYPELTSNLYLDKSLVLYGRYPRGTENMLFQVFGKSDSERCDMIFNLPLDAATSSRDKSIRKEWALQKLYTLLGQYARNENREILEQIRQTARTYHLSVPYKGWYKSALKK